MSPNKLEGLSLASFFQPWGLYYKVFLTRNLRKIDRFRNKLVSFELPVPFTGLDKHANLNEHASLLRIQYITDP
jgi:hypothetical protein